MLEEQGGTHGNGAAAQSTPVVVVLPWMNLHDIFCTPKGICLANSSP